MKTQSKLLGATSLFLLSTTAFAGVTSLHQELLYTCDATKWNNIQIVKNTEGNDVTYALILNSYSRDRSTVGIFTESTTNVVFDLRKVSKDANGVITFEGNFGGTQPENESTTFLVGRPNADKSLTFSLVAGPHKVDRSNTEYEDKNYSFDFFKERIKTHLIDSEALDGDQIVCHNEQ